MVILKDLWFKTGALLWSALLLAACQAAAGTIPLPAPELAASPTGTMPEEIDPGSTRIPADKYDDLEIVTLLPRDAIPAIDNPQFLAVAEADDFYDPDELVIGVIFNGDARAYSVPYLSNHEIVNDAVGGVKIAITW